MPWNSASRPNLSVGAVVAAGRKAGFDCSSLDANLTFACKIGWDGYETLAETPSFFGVCEHVFAVDIFGKSSLRSDQFLAQFESDFDENPFIAMRDVQVPELLDEITQRVLSVEADVVGFSCTFSQVFPSVALAKRLKAIDLRIVTILGGACVHGEMGQEYAWVFRSEIDHVFLGEADRSFPQLLYALADSGSVDSIPGVTSNGISRHPPELVENLDDLGPPDYSGYFSERDRLLNKGMRLGPVSALPFESSRGCWWGQKNHCVFCGLNNEGMRFRSKSPINVTKEIADQGAKYGSTSFMAADNILTHRDFHELLAELTDLGLDLRLFYEVKANMKRDEVATLAQAGVKWVQPGIESFSDNLLNLMRKGVTALQNVQFLKWCAEFNLNVSYNILMGFPGESAQDYQIMAALIRRIFHLSPPSDQPCFVQVHRFSPFHSAPQQFGIQGLAPAEYYKYLVPNEFADLTKMAYFFARKECSQFVSKKEVDELVETVQDWRKAKVTKVARLGPGFVEIDTTLQDERPETRRLSPSESAAFVLADRVTTRKNITARMANEYSFTASEAASGLESLVTHGLALEDSNRIVTTIPFERPKLTSEIVAWVKRWLHRDSSLNSFAERIPVVAQSQ